MMTHATDHAPDRATDGSAEHLADWSAVRLAEAVASREVSAVEVMRAHLERIEERNPRLRAVVSQQPDSVSLAAAEDADRATAEAHAAGDPLPLLHGLPTAVKDLMDVAGLPTTNGSAAFADAPPAAHDSVLATLLRDAGAIIIGKTNTPEMGQGVLTFNPVFGTTVNPWDTARHAGGSSGGAAAALAARMLPIADGSDSGGSLRYRPPSATWSASAPARSRAERAHRQRVDAARGHRADGARLRRRRTVHGRPRGRAVGLADVRHDPAPGASGRGRRPPDRLERRRRRPADRPGDPCRAPGVRRAARGARSGGRGRGARLRRRRRGLGDHRDVRVLPRRSARGRRRRERVPPDYVRNVEQGRATTATQLADAYERRTRLYRDTAAVLDRHDVLVLPATPVVAPPADDEWVDTVDGHRFERYFTWQMLANRLTLTAHPVVVTSAGFTAEGLPVGVQVVGRYGREAQLLAVTRAIEEATGWIRRAPAR